MSLRALRARTFVRARFLFPSAFVLISISSCSREQAKEQSVSGETPSPPAQSQARAENLTSQILAQTVRQNARDLVVNAELLNGTFDPNPVNVSAGPEISFHLHIDPPAEHHFQINP